MAAKSTRQKRHGSKPRKPRREHGRRLRERVFGQIASPENAAEITIRNMDLYIRWIETGHMIGTPKLRVVYEREAMDRGQ